MRGQMQKGKFIRCKAPLRISFAGGGTDASPYCDERGGAVLNSTTDQFAYCTISPRSDEQITIRSNEAWMYKKNDTNNISNNYLDKIYNTAMSTGAIGGKISGAGGRIYVFYM